MAAALDGDMALERQPEQRQVAEQVEHLVAHELVGPAQPVAVQDAELVHHHGVVEVAPAGEAAPPERLHLAQEAEGAGAAQLALEALVVDHEVPELLAADRRMGEVDRVGDPQPAARLDADQPVAVADLERAAHAQRAARNALVEDAGRPDQEHERGGAAVHHRNLGAVDLDAHVVDAEAAERGEQMLDGADARIAAPERGGEAGRGGRRAVRWQLHRLRQVRAHEHDAGIRPCGLERALHGLARVESDARTRDLLGDRPLHEYAFPPNTPHSSPDARTRSRRGDQGARLVPTVTTPREEAGFGFFPESPRTYVTVL